MNDQLTHTEKTLMRIEQLIEYGTAKCSDCEQPMFWAKTPKGKNIALDFGRVDEGKRYTLQIGGSVDAPPRSLTAWFTESKSGYRCHWPCKNSEAGVPVSSPEPHPAAPASDPSYSPVSHVRTDGEGHYLGVDVCICPPLHEGDNKACPVCWGNE